MGILVEDIPDVIKSYLARKRRQRYVDIARNRQFSIVAEHFFNNSTVKKETKKAVEYEMRFMANRFNNSRWKNIDSADAPARGNLVIKGSVKMAFADTNMIVNAMEPAFASGGEDEVINYLDLQYQNMIDGHWEFFDDSIFQLQAAGTNPPAWNTIPYWVVPGASTDFKFDGLNPSGYSAGPAGLDRTTNANAGLRNGSYKFASVDPFDFGKKTAEAMQKSGFKPYQTVGKKRAQEDVAAQRFSLFSDFDLYQEYQDYFVTAQEDYGSDQSRFRGGKMASPNVFMSELWHWVPDKQVNGVETPVIGTRYLYGLDLSTWELNPYGEWFMKEMKDVRVSDNHNEYVTYMDTGLQLVNLNPRANFVGVPA